MAALEPRNLLLQKSKSEQATRSAVQKLNPHRAAAHQRSTKTSQAQRPHLNVRNPRASQQTALQGTVARWDPGRGRQQWGSP